MFYWTIKKYILKIKTNNLFFKTRYKNIFNIFSKTLKLIS